MMTHKIHYILFIVITLTSVITSNAQTFETKDIVGKYRFKVTWMTYIETYYHIKRNGSYKLAENFEGKIQKGEGTWKISGDSIVLSPLSPKTGPLSLERSLPIWIDSLEKVQIGNYKRSRQKIKKNSSSDINSYAIGWNSLNSDSVKFIAVVNDSTKIIVFTEEELDQSSGYAGIDLESLIQKDPSLHNLPEIPFGWFAILDLSTNEWLVDEGNLEDLKKLYLTMYKRH